MRALLVFCDVYHVVPSQAEGDTHVPDEHYSCVGLLVYIMHSYVHGTPSTVDGKFSRNCEIVYYGKNGCPEKMSLVYLFLCQNFMWAN